MLHHLVNAVFSPTKPRNDPDILKQNPCYIQSMHTPGTPNTPQATPTGHTPPQEETGEEYVEIIAQT